MEIGRMAAAPVGRPITDRLQFLLKKKKKKILIFFFSLFIIIVCVCVCVCVCVLCVCVRGWKEEGDLLSSRRPADPLLI